MHATHAALPRLELAGIRPSSAPPTAASRPATRPASRHRRLGQDRPAAREPSCWSEIELRDRMLLRDESAWREFHRRYDRLIHRAIRSVTRRFGSVLGSADLEEIYAIFLCSLNQRDMHKLRSFDAQRGRCLGAWVAMLAANASWDFLRRLARSPHSDDAAEAESVYCLEPDPFCTLAAKEEWHKVDATLRKFSERDRTFVELLFLQGCTPEQTAEAMSISIKTVYSKKHKIRCRLAGALSRRAFHAQAA